MSYAKSTSVDSAKSQSEIQSTLMRFGADGFMSGSQRMPDGRECAMVAFQFKGLMVRFTMQLPNRDSAEFAKSPTGKVTYDVNQRYKLWDQACKARWRALFLAIKAKLVAVEEGISTVEQEFLAWVILPNGMSAGDHMLPKLAEAAKSGNMPLLGWDGRGE